MRKKANPGTVWARLQAAMDEAGMPPTQAHAAHLAKRAQPTVNQWNRPGNYPDLPAAIKLASELNVCVEYLLTGRGNKRPIPVGDRYWNAIAEAWSLLTDKERTEVAKIATGYAARAGAIAAIKDDADAQAAPGQLSRKAEAGVLRRRRR